MKITANLPNLNYLNKKIIWIIGLERSGTTVLGNLLGSCKDVEYLYEPDTLYPILYLKNKISHDKWKMLFECYFYNDLLRNRINNRQINLNKTDDSYYFNYKNKLEQNKKIFDIFKKNKIIPRSKIIIKVPGLIDEIVNLKKLYKNFQFIIIERTSSEIVNSIIKKAWFKKNYDNRHFPYIKKGTKLYPFWLNKKYYKIWNTFNEYEKAAFYVIEYKKKISKLKNLYNVKYDQLTDNPKIVFKDISKKFNLSPTHKTISLIKKIKKIKKNILNLKKKLRKEIYNKLNQLS